MSIIDYLFNGGGSVRSKGSPRGGARGGRPSLPEPTPAPTWDTEREYNKFQTRANEPGARLAEQWAFDMNRANDKWPWTLDVTRTGQPQGQHKTQGQWNVKSSNFKPPTMWARNEEQDSGVMAARINDPSVNEMRNNYTRTSIDPMTWPGSQYFGIGGYDFVKDHAPTLENLAFFQDIKDKDAMARDTNFQVTLPEHEKLGKLSGYELLPKGFYPYLNPSLIENEPSWGGDYMIDLWGGKGKVGFRKGLDDDDYNAYAKWVKSW